MVVKEEGRTTFSVGKFVAWVVFGLLLFTGLLGSFFEVDAGQKAVVLRFGAINKEVGEGFHFKAPFIDNVVKFDNRVLKTEVKAPSYSKDAQTVDMLIAVNYRLGQSASDIYRNLGTDYAGRVIDPAVQDSVKKIVARYDAQTLLDNYSQVARDIGDDLDGRLTSFGLDVVGVSIVNHDYSAAFEASIEAKQLAVQQALKAENDYRRIQIESQQKVAVANATAESVILQGKADASAKLAIAEADARALLLKAESEAKALELQREQLTPALLELRSIEVQREYASRWDGALPKTVLGDSQGQLLQLPESILNGGR